MARNGSDLKCDFLQPFGIRLVRRDSERSLRAITGETSKLRVLIEKAIAFLFLLSRDAQGAILVYDVTKQVTLQKLDSWLSELEIYGTKPNMIKMIVGNKIDEAGNREISRDEGIRFAKKHRTLFLETSAKTSEGVKEAFEEVVRKILETTDLWDNRASGGAAGTVNLNADHGEEAASYCNGLCTLA